MAKIYDISAKITNELPKIMITEDIIVTINNRKKTMLDIKAFANEIDRKAEELDRAGKGEEAETLQNEFITKALKMLVGEKNTDAIEALDLPLPEYQMVYQAVMAAARGEDPTAEPAPSTKQ